VTPGTDNSAEFSSVELFFPVDCAIWAGLIVYWSLVWLGWNALATERAVT
jgi:hypothetical protein